METKDTDKTVEEAAENVKKTSRKASEPTGEKQSVETATEGVEVVQTHWDDQTINLPYYDNHAITALILAVLSVVAPFLAFGLGGVVGLTLGIIALYQVKQSLKMFENSMTQTSKILAIIGIILSVLAIGIAVTFMVSAAWHMYEFFEPSRLTFGPRFTYYHRTF
ncbi:MAG: DUF4190 domain-containing protein [Sphaerochaetaceae bacterium]|nr:DUF4190 domain-containing protein [Sphaerochaetaceae bacterium]